jgi:hypothetical protein
MTTHNNFIDLATTIGEIFQVKIMDLLFIAVAEILFAGELKPAHCCLSPMT